MGFRQQHSPIRKTRFVDKAAGSISKSGAGKSFENGMDVASSLRHELKLVLNQNKLSRQRIFVEIFGGSGNLCKAMHAR
eukprot:12427554-Karenia_brevis.AAC.1